MPDARRTALARGRRADWIGSGKLKLGSIRLSAGGCAPCASRSRRPQDRGQTAADSLSDRRCRSRPSEENRRALARAACSHGAETRCAARHESSQRPLSDRLHRQQWRGAAVSQTSRAILFTDPRYTVQSQQQANCRVRIAKGPLTNRAHCMEIDRAGRAARRLRTGQP